MLGHKRLEGKKRIVFSHQSSWPTDIQDPKPAVYQLRDAQAKNNTICLFTDFSSQVSNSEDVPPEVFVSNHTVLDMRSMDSKSNGAIAWSDHSSLNCKDAFRQNASYPSSGECHPKLSPCFRRGPAQVCGV